MSFEHIGFATLFHSAFRIDSTSLVAHLAMENRIRPYAEKVLLDRLVFASARVGRPRVTSGEVIERFDDMRLELDYPEAARARRLLEECDITLEQVDRALKHRMTLEKAVDRFIAGLWSDQADREAVCWQAFLDLDLRGHVVRAVSLELLGAMADASRGAPAEELAAARRHLLLRHELSEWPALISRLESWGVDADLIDQYVSTYAAALAVDRPSPRPTVPNGATHEPIRSARRLRKTAGSFERTIPVEQTVERLLALRPHYGITRVTDVTGLDDLGIPVHCAFRPRSVSAASVHSGKGLTPAESLASALAESIEGDCGERYAPSDLIRGTLANLRRRNAMAVIPPYAVPGGRGIPEELALDWVVVDDLLAVSTDQRRVLLPLEFIRQGGANPERRVLFGVTMSAGLASGNVIEEAINHAICELIERDAVAIFTFRAKYLRQDLRRHYCRVDLRSLPARVGALVDKVRAAGRHIALVDVTTDVGVSTIICKITSHDGRYCGGFGASLSAERAALRAITEAAQTSTANVQGAREDLAVLARDPRIHERTFGLESARARELFDDPTASEKPFESLPSAVHEYVDEDQDALLRALRAAGIEHLYVCDVSDEACVDFRVVRAVVPELERSRVDCIGPRRLRCALG